MGELADKIEQALEPDELIEYAAMMDADGWATDLGERVRATASEIDALRAALDARCEIIRNLSDANAAIRADLAACDATIEELRTALKDWQREYYDDECAACGPMPCEDHLEAAILEAASVVGVEE